MKATQIDPLYNENQIDTLLNLTEESDFSIAGINHDDEWRSDLKWSLLSGEKVAIGAWVYKKFSGDSRELAGFCVLSKSKPIRQRDLELELIYVKNGFRIKSGSDFRWMEIKGVIKEHIGNLLLNKAEDLCAEYGYERLIVHNPKSIKAITKFLLRNNFDILYFDLHRELYKFVKIVEPKYNLDPFDQEQIITWVCRKWGIEISGWENSIKAQGTFNFNIESSWTNEVHIFLCENLREFTNIRQEYSSYQNCLLFLQKEDTSDITPPNSFCQIITPARLREITNNVYVRLEPEISPRGLLVPILPDSFDKFRKWRSNVFLDGGDYGQVLLRGMNKSEPAFIMFSDSARNNEILLGVAQITDIYADTPHNIWKRAKAKSTFDEISFNSYKNIKTRMTAIEFDKLEQKEWEIDFVRHSSGLGWTYVNATLLYNKILPHYSTHL